MNELDYKSLFPYYFEDDVKPVLSTTTTIWMESSDDILKVICENIGDISSLVNLSYTCKIMRDSVINTTLYKEKKQEKENSDLCWKIDDLLIDKIVKQNHWDDPPWRTRLFRLKKADVSDIEMMIDEEKKKLNNGCLKTLELIIDGDYCDWQHSRNPNERLYDFACCCSCCSCRACRPRRREFLVCVPDVALGNQVNVGLEF